MMSRALIIGGGTGGLCAAIALRQALSRRTYGTIPSREMKTSPHRCFLLLCMCEPHSLLQEEHKEDSHEPAPCSEAQPIEP